MAQPEFEQPDFLGGQTADEIHERMMNELPKDIDDMPGGFPFDLTMPAALEKDELINFHLKRTLQLAFPEYAWDEWLDMHGAQVHVERHKASFATGYVQVTATDPTNISEGAVFCTPATENSESIEFLTTQDTFIEEDSTALIPVIAVEEGTGSNVSSGTVTLMGTPSDSIVAVTNPEPITGGAERETDDDYYDRIAAEYRSATTFLGNDTDFVRWAKAAGAGDCIVIDAPDGPGTVKLVIVDAQGRPASSTLINAVYNYIVSPTDRSARLLPTACAQLSVVSAETVEINYTLTGLVFDESTNIEQIKNDFRIAVLAAYTESQTDNVLRYNDVRPLIKGISGVEDFETFLMNGSTGNILLDSDEYPETGTLDFS